MKKYIGHRTLNTEAAAELGRHSSSTEDEYAGISETLYKSRTGVYFIHAEGNASALYKMLSGRHCRRWAKGGNIRVLDYDEAKEWSVKYLPHDLYEAEFGDIKGAKNEKKEQIGLKLPQDMKALLEELAAKTQYSLSGITSDILSSALENGDAISSKKSIKSSSTRMSVYLTQTNIRKLDRLKSQNNASRNQIAKMLIENHLDKAASSL
ncbi:MAG: hypothetical protein LBU32_04685 [Clostridiales bacterium]|jgi:predicted transcriptional regulator|nr:hypothetical protein [Clostridiales bacterium]